MTTFHLFLVETKPPLSCDAGFSSKDKATNKFAFMCTNYILAECVARLLLKRGPWVQSPGRSNQLPSSANQHFCERVLRSPGDIFTKYILIVVIDGFFLSISS